MARGWESKSVEAQQQDASVGRAARRQAPTTPEQRSEMQRRHTLELARARTAADLQRSSSSAHRSMLEQALRALDEQIEAIDARR